MTTAIILLYFRDNGELKAWKSKALSLTYTDKEFSGSCNECLLPSNSRGGGALLKTRLHLF
jgi:hypothetical protein